MRYYVKVYYHNRDIEKFCVNALSFGHALTKATKAVCYTGVSVTSVYALLPDQNIPADYPLIKIK